VTIPALVSLESGRFPADGVPWGDTPRHACVKKRTIAVEMCTATHMGRVPSLQASTETRRAFGSSRATSVAIRHTHLKGGGGGSGGGGGREARQCNHSQRRRSKKRVGAGRQVQQVPDSEAVARETARIRTEQVDSDDAFDVPLHARTRTPTRLCELPPPTVMLSGPVGEERAD
jgi:hypothetical protein